VLTDLLKETPDRVVSAAITAPHELIEERVTKLGRKAIVYWGAHSTPERHPHRVPRRRAPRADRSRAGSEDGTSSSATCS